MADTDGYSGWTNRATWAVALHVNNDQGWQEQIMDLARQYLAAPREEEPDGPEETSEDDASGFREALKESITAIVDPLAYVEEFGDCRLSEWNNGPGMAARDIGDLDDVNWHELAESFIRDVREG
jgi:hypothetical protein